MNPKTPKSNLTKHAKVCPGREYITEYKCVDVCTDLTEALVVAVRAAVARDAAAAGMLLSSLPAFPPFLDDLQSGSRSALSRPSL